MLVYKHMRCFHMPNPCKKKVIFMSKTSLGNTWNPLYSVLGHFRSYILGLRSYLRKRFGPDPPPPPHDFQKKTQILLFDESWKWPFLAPCGFWGFWGPFWPKQGKKGRGAQKALLKSSGTSLASTLSLSLPFPLFFFPSLEPGPRLPLPLSPSYPYLSQTLDRETPPKKKK